MGGVPGLGPAVEQGDRGGVADEGGSTPHGLGGDQGMGEQARAGLSVVGPGWSGQLHRLPDRGPARLLVEQLTGPVEDCPTIAGGGLVAPDGVELLGTKALEPADHL